MKVRMRKMSNVVKSHRSEQRAEGRDGGDEGAGGGGESVQSKDAGLPYSSGAIPEARDKPASLVKAAQRAEGGSRGRRAGGTSSMTTVVAGGQPAP